MSALAGTALALAGGVIGAGGVFAQMDGSGRGVTPVDSGSDYEVTGVTVDVAADTADAARYGGWRLAQRKAWKQLADRLGSSTGAIGDGTLNQIVSGIVVENEQIGPKRYIARLGVLFNRARAASLLGVSAYADRSTPVLVVPVQWSAGVASVFEQRTDWQEAWARFRTGSSAIDYVRLAGTGGDPLLVNFGQTQRPGRGWWRSVIDQYGASDVIIPTVRLYRQWPGGPVIGVFEARHGPDNAMLGGFTLRVGSSAGLPQLLDAGVKRLDALYAAALRQGALDPDPTLSPPPQPVAADITADDDAGGEDTVVDDVSATGASAGIAITVQVDTPTASAVANAESALRSVSGVRGAQTTSLALGGVSVVRVTYDGDPDAFRAALESRGYQVLGQGQAIRIRLAPRLLPPDITSGSAGPG